MSVFQTGSVKSLRRSTSTFNKSLAAGLAVLLTLLWPGLSVGIVAQETTTILNSTSASSVQIEITEPSLAPSTSPAAELDSDEIDWQASDSLKQGSWPLVEQIEANAYIVVDRLSGAVLLAKAEQIPFHPASTTKIMTALLAIENLSLDSLITASEEATDLPAGSSAAGFLTGETTTVRDGLAGLMLPSGNDAANMLAEAISGDVSAFAIRMNERAIELGAVNTHFVNPHGLDDELHVSTAADLALITAEAMRFPVFRELVATPVYAMAATNLHPYHGWAILANTNNRLLLANQSNYRSSQIETIGGVKTGTTADAGLCLVTAATSTDGQELICVLLGVRADDADGNPSSYTRSLLENAVAKQAASSPSTRTVLLTAGQAVDLPESDWQIVPERALSYAINPDRETQLQWIWPDPTGHDDGDALDLRLTDHGQTVVSVPVHLSRHEPTAEASESQAESSDNDAVSQNPVATILEWPLLKTALMLLGGLGLILLVYGWGWSAGHRKGWQAKALAEQRRKQQL